MDVEVSVIEVASSDDTEVVAVEASEDGCDMVDAVVEGGEVVSDEDEASLEEELEPDVDVLKDEFIVSICVRYENLYTD